MRAAFTEALAKATESPSEMMLVIAADAIAFEELQGDEVTAALNAERERVPASVVAMYKRSKAKGQHGEARRGRRSHPDSRRGSERRVAVVG